MILISPAEAILCTPYWDIAIRIKQVNCWLLKKYLEISQNNQQFINIYKWH